MTPIAHVRAQAKVNLFLRILAQERSGYHALETLFARLDLADDLIVRPTSGVRSLDSRGAETGPTESNLAWRAAVAYASATGWPAGFEIEIEKRIPVGGGLGGGSADAGAVLRALNALAPAPLPAHRLLALAGSLGADVPFMTLAAPLALAWARGDRLLALPPLPARPVSLVTFPFGVSSGAAFGWVADARAAGQHRVEATTLELDGLRDWNGVARLAGNDFEAEVGARHPAIADSLEVARAAGALIAQLSGSGSTVLVVPGSAGPSRLTGLPDSARVLETRTAFSVEDVALIR